MACCGAEVAGGDAGADLLTKIQRLMPDIPEKLISEYLADSQRRFARQAGVWRYADYEACVVRGDGVHTIDTGDDVRVIRVEDVFVQRCGCATCEAKLPERHNRHVHCGCCPDQWWWEQVPGKLVFNREWHKDYSLRIALVLAPANNSDAFPSALLDHHQDVVKSGALAELYMLPDQDWTSYELAGYHKAEFERGMREARAAELRDMKPDRPEYSGSRYSGGMQIRGRGCR